MAGVFRVGGGRRLCKAAQDGFSLRFQLGIFQTRQLQLGQTGKFGAQRAGLRLAVEVFGESRARQRMVEVSGCQQLQTIRIFYG